jgi:ADP-ribosylglycohydrolase
MNPEWLIITADDLRYEREQLRDEGKDLGSIREDFEEVIEALDSAGPTVEKVEDRVDVVDSAIDASALREQRGRAQALMDAGQELPVRDGYAYEEPSDLAGITSARPAAEPAAFDPAGEPVSEHIHGAWLGRCAGCLLGKPVEGWTTEKMHAILKAENNFPLSRYVSSDVPDTILDEWSVDPEGVFRSAIDRVDHMPEDDDTNYTVAGLDLVGRHGDGFGAEDVARYWMRNVPLLRTHTAERVAYRNFANLVGPPESARHRNPYREWIGALIRADPYGYVKVGRPAEAAELAWRDARVSHVKNGIYGAMWVAAMLAVAPGADSLEEVIRAGLAQVPERSRLRDAVTDVLDWQAAGIGYEAAFDRLHDRWDETHYHHWCHTISNAQIIAIGLLWGGGELGPSICRTVQAGFDTDSSGATVGSIVGMYRGVNDLADEWVAPLADRIETGIDGYAEVPISELAAETTDLAVP